MSFIMLSTYIKTFINQFLLNLLPKVNLNRSKFLAFSSHRTCQTYYLKKKKKSINQNGNEETEKYEILGLVLRVLPIPIQNNDWLINMMTFLSPFKTQQSFQASNEILGKKYLQLKPKNIETYLSQFSLIYKRHDLPILNPIPTSHPTT